MFDFVKKYIDARNACDDDYDDYDEVYGTCKACDMGNITVDDEGHVYCDYCESSWYSVEEYERCSDFEKYENVYPYMDLYLDDGNIYTEKELIRAHRADDPDELIYPYCLEPVHPLCDCGYNILDDCDGHYFCSGSLCGKKYTLKGCKRQIRRGLYE